MKAEKTNGARFALQSSNARDEYARAIIGTGAFDIKPQRAEFAGGNYIVAVGARLPPEPETVYLTETGDHTTDPQQARVFDEYADALKWVVENCEFPQDDLFPVPRGFERPRFPRVCCLRVYTEVEPL